MIKKGYKILIVFSTILISFYICLGFIEQTFSLTRDNYNTKNQLNISRSWDLTGTPIYINDSDPGYNWSKTAADNDWVSGSGSWGDPYLIENVSIDSVFEGSGIYIVDSNVPFIIRNCTILSADSGPISFYEGSGIILSNVSHASILNNKCFNNERYGITLIKSSNNTISYNTISNNGQTGISLRDSSNNNIFEGNILNYNHDQSIGIYKSNFNNFTGNIINEYKLSPSDYSTKYISIRGFNNFFTGNIMNNSGMEIHIGGDLSEISSHIIDPTNLVNGKPIYYYANKQNLDRLNFSNAGQIILINVESSEVSNLNFSNGAYGISLYYCNNITILNNSFEDISKINILLFKSSNNEIINNTIKNLDYHSYGIQLYVSNSNNNISGNIIKSCNTALEVSYSSDYNLIEKNDIINNMYGLRLQEGKKNIIRQNKIANTNQDGISISWQNAINNTVYLNEFYNNQKHVEDTVINAGGINTKWDNGEFGNYWDDYNGFDSNDDGIGDVSYSIMPGHIDNFPLWWDPPAISIKSPLKDDLFGKISPEFNISVDEGMMHSLWYVLNDSLMSNLTFNSSGTINQGLWNSVLNGTVKIKFFVNDSKGYTSSVEVVVRKDNFIPIVKINLPTANKLFGFNVPSYNITIIEPNLHSIWYRLNNGTFITTSVSIDTFYGSIDQNVWDQVGNGTVTIQFFANDTAGNIGYTEVLIRKDIIFPIVNVNLPTANKLFGINVPSYNITTIEPNLHSIWYRLKNGTSITNNVLIDTFYGSIDQNVWDQIGNGTVTIQFFANDTAGNIGFTEVLIRKDNLVPKVNINLPTANKLFGFNVPNYNITIIESNLHSIWYRLNNGAFITTKVSIDTFYGSIDQYIWDQVGNGTILIQFFANDTAGNVGYTEVFIRKDIIVPIVNVNLPTANKLFGFNVPNYNITIIESNLHSLWYRLNNGTFITTKVSIDTFYGSIDQYIWDQVGNGTILIQFFANDTTGNIGYTEIVVRKEVSPPIITINFPSLNDLFGSNVPSYNITIIEESLDSIWFRLNNGIIVTEMKIIETLYGSIDQYIWDQVGNGTVLIQFYANDTLGNIGYFELVIRKDIMAPIITIISPLSNEVFGAFSPSYEIIIEEGNLVAIWYTVDNGSLNLVINNFNGILNQTLWDLLPEGQSILRFYANDTMGNVGFMEVSIYKEVNESNDSELIMTISFSIVIGGAIIGVTFIIYKKLPKNQN